MPLHEGKRSLDVVVFPGSFDPLTKGHSDLVHRALRYFDRVVVAVLSNSKKSTLFTPDERVDVIREVFADQNGRVEVQHFSGLLVEFAQRVGTRAILRGLRAISDYEYEAQMAIMNRHLSSEVETFFLTSRAEYSYISSSLVREVALLGGEITPFVPPAVEAAVHAKVKQIKRTKE